MAREEYDAYSSSACFSSSSMVVSACIFNSTLCSRTILSPNLSFFRAGKKVKEVKQEVTILHCLLMGNFQYLSLKPKIKCFLHLCLEWLKAVLVMEYDDGDVSADLQALQDQAHVLREKTYFRQGSYDNCLTQNLFINAFYERIG